MFPAVEGCRESRPPYGNSAHCVPKLKESRPLKTSSWQSPFLRRADYSKVIALVAFVIFLIAARPYPASAATPATKAAEPATAPATPATKAVEPATAPAAPAAKALEPAPAPVPVTAASATRAIAAVTKAAPVIKSAAAAPAPQSAQGSGPRIWLQDSKPLTTNYVGASPAGANGPAKSKSSSSGRPLPGDGGGDPGTPPPSPPSGPAGILAAGKATPLALASADFNEDGFDDLAAGYAAPGGSGIIAIHRGNIDAFAPQSDASFQAIGRGEFPSPFLTNVRVFAVPVTPDFIATGTFTASGHTDLIIAARGGNAVYLLAGDGAGNFAAPVMIDLPGGVTALGAGQLGNSGAFMGLVVGVSVSSQQSDL